MTSLRDFFSVRLPSGGSRLLLRSVSVSREEHIGPAIRKRAFNLCRDIDPKDTPVAMTLYLDGKLWTGDRKLKAGLLEKGVDRFYDPSL